MSGTTRGRIPDLVVQDLIERADLASLIGESVQLRRTGQNWSGLCPFHEEKTPSFTVSPTKNFYYCFGCAASGNAISFLMDYHHLSFVESCENLAQRLGIHLPKEATTTHAPEKPLEPLYKALALAKDYFYNALIQLPDHHPAKRYLKQRGITDQSIQTFEIGYAPPGWDHLQNHLAKSGVPEHISLEAGLLTNGKHNKVYDRFRNRLIFPILDPKNRTIGFGGRSLNDEQPKYLNSPESPVFHKRLALFGLPKVIKAGKHKQLMVTEGYFDVIRMHQVSLPYAVAALGTATSQEQVQTLFRYCDHILACFDGDSAGEKAAWRFLENSLPIIQSHQKIDFLFLPAGEDPDSYIHRNGKEAFLVASQEQQSLTEFFIATLSKDLQLTKLDDRAQLIKRAAPLIGQIRKSILKDLLIQHLSEVSQLPSDRIQSLVDSSQDLQPSQDVYQQQVTEYPTHQNQSQHQPWPVSNNRWHKSARWSKNPKQPPVIPGYRYLIDSMLKLLLQQPELAQQTTLELETKPSLPGYQLFEDTFNQLRENPEASPGYLMGLWHNLPEGAHIAQLAAEEFLIPSTSLDIEFADGLHQLEAIALNQALTQAARQQPIDIEKLQKLLEKKKNRDQQKPNSADVNIS